VGVCFRENLWHGIDGRADAIGTASWKLSPSQIQFEELSSRSNIVPVIVLLQRSQPDFE
jgi:hypothetical protein